MSSLAGDLPVRQEGARHLLREHDALIAGSALAAGARLGARFTDFDGRPAVWALSVFASHRFDHRRCDLPIPCHPTMIPSTACRQYVDFSTKNWEEFTPLEPRFMGLSEEQAYQLAEELHLVLRVRHSDDEMLTLDLRSGRMSVEIREGHVVQASAG